MPTKKTEKSDKPDKPAKPAAITKHRAAVTRKAGEGQTFDVVPPSKVVPSATSRPVITANRPQQADNTLVSDVILTDAPSSAPLVHKKLALDIKPASGPSDTPAEPETVTAAADDGVQGAPEMPAEPGPTVAELLSAKQAAEADGAGTEAGKQAEAAESETPASLDAEQTAEATDNAQDDKAEVAEPPKPETKPESPATGDTDPATAVEADKPAEAAKPETEAEDDTLAGVLTTEQPSEQSAHTPELKQALDDLKTSDEGKHPHEAKLYGGKPVIVVHEAHPVLTTLKWLFWFIFSLALALLAFNLLLDAGVVSIGTDLPHTDIIKD